MQYLECISSKVAKLTHISYTLSVDPHGFSTITCILTMNNDSFSSSFQVLIHSFIHSFYLFVLLARIPI